MTAKWTSGDVPGQHGRLAVVTGANTGLGFETARVLAARGASVVLAVRDTDKGKAAAARIAVTAPGADVTVQRLDLASLDSVRAAAAELRARHPAIDLLINNAGVMFTPQAGHPGRVRAAARHQPPGALRPHRAAARADAAGAGLPRGDGQQPRAPRPGPDQLRRPAGRAVLPPGGRVQPVQAGQPDVHLRAATPAVRRGHTTTIAVAAHPGAADTELTRNSSAASAALARRISQTAAMGALPVLRAATDPGVLGGQYYGPGGLVGTRGYPELARSSGQSRDTALQRRLWTASEELTGVTFPV